MSKTFNIERIDKELPVLLNRLKNSSEKRLASLLKKWPQKFLNRAIAFYPSVLKTPTGRLKRSFTPFTRRLGENVVAFGLRAGSDSDPIKYARALHDGFKGTVNIPSHIRKVGFRSIKTGRRLKRKGKFGVEQVGRVRAHTRKMNIRPRKYFEIPMRLMIPDLIKSIKEAPGFKE